MRAYVISLDVIDSRNKNLDSTIIEEFFKRIYDDSIDSFITKPDLIKGDECQFIFKDDAVELFKVLRKLLSFFELGIRVAIVRTDMDYISPTLRFSYKTNHESFYLTAHMLNLMKGMKNSNKERGVSKVVSFAFSPSMESLRVEDFNVLRESSLDQSDIVSKLYNAQLKIMEKWNDNDFIICQGYIESLSNSQIAERILKANNWCNENKSYLNPAYISRVLTSKNIRLVAEMEEAIIKVIKLLIEEEKKCTYYY